MNEEILKKLYESASSVFDMPSYDQFVLDMQDDTKLNSFRSSMSEHYDMPEFDQLKSDLGVVKKKEDTASPSVDGSLELRPISDLEFDKDTEFQKKFKSTGLNTLSNLSRIPAFIQEQVITAFGSEEDKKLLNDMTFEQRETALAPISLPGNVSAGWRESSESLRQKAKEIEDTIEQYDQSITEDIGDLQLGRASYRLFNEVGGAIPSIMQAMIPYVGLASMGLSTAAGKSRELQEEGEGLSRKTSATAALYGIAEAALETVTRGIGKKFFKSLSGQSDEYIKNTIKEFGKQTAKDFAKEGASELGTEILQNMTDYAVQGDEDAFNKELSHYADIFIIGGFATAPLSAGGQGIGLARQTAQKRELGRKLENSKYTDLTSTFVDPTIDADTEMVAEPQNKKFLKFDLDQKVESGEMTQAEADQVIKNFENTIYVKNELKGLEIPAVHRTNIANLILEKRDLKAKVEGKDPVLVAKDVERIKAIDEEIKNFIEVEETLQEAEAVVTEPTVTQVTPDKVSDVLNRPVTLTQLGGSALDAPIEGDLYVEGQQVVLEDADGNITEIGNVNEISNSSLEEIGIKIAEPNVKTLSNGNLQVGEDILVPDKKGIKKNKRGDISRVVLRNEDGSVTRTLRGVDAEEAAYQILLKEATSPEQAESINQLLEQDDQFREATAATQAQTGTDTQQDPKQKYVQELTQTKQQDPKTYWTVSDVDPEVASESTLIETEDGAAMVKPDGDIVGVYKKMSSKAKGVAQDLLKRAVEAGGRKLDNFDNYLTPIYKKAGFRIVGRIAFNEEYAPDGWKPEFGKPDVVAMVYDPNNELDIEERTFQDYDEMIAYRDSFIGDQQNIQEEVNKLRELFKTPSLKTQVDNVISSLSRIAPNVKIIVHSNEDSYAKAAKEENVTDKSSGTYDPNTKTIHINANKANIRTVYHEAFHAILLNYVKNNAEAKQLTDRMIKAVMKVVPADVKAELELFASQYESNIQSEEKLAELFGILAGEYRQLPTNTQGVVKRFLDKVAKAVGLKEFTDAEVIDVLNVLAGKVSKGETIQQADILSVVEKTSNFEYISKENADTWTDDMVRRQRRTKPDPVNTVKAYKLFRVKPNEPGKLFPLFVNADDFIEIGSWIDAEVGELTNEGKVKSKIGNLAYRPGWHMGDLPIATHIGDKYNFKKGDVDKSLKKPTARSANHVWAEVDVAADVNWQTVANERASKTKDGKVIPRTAHITDQIPEDGYYRYKTNPNMTGEWLISGSIKVNRVLTDQEVIEINREAGVADLPRVNPIDLKSLGFETKANTEELSIRKRKVGQFETSYFEDSKEFKDLVDAGLVINNYEIGKLYGVKVAIHQPDNMFVGTLKHKGNKFFEGQGGIFYTPSTGNFWASGSKNSAEQLAKLINNNEVDGVRRMVLVRGTDPKMLSSTEGVKAAMSIVELMVDNGLIPRKDFRSSLIRVGKKYDIDFSGSDSSAAIRKDIEDKFMKPSDSTFQKRGFFFDDIIDDLSKTSEKTKNNSEKIREFLGFDKRKITFGKQGIKDAIGDILTERTLLDLPNSHVYAVIESTSEVVVRPATKEELSNPEHGSYPYVLVTKDGSKPVLKLLSVRPHAVKDGVFTMKDGSQPSQAKLGLAQRGMGEAVISMRKQMSSPVGKIVSKAKENGISDAAILKYLAENNLDVNEGNRVIDSINEKERRTKQKSEGLFDPQRNVVVNFLDNMYKTWMSGRGYRPLSMQALSEYKEGSIEAEVRIARRSVKDIERAIKSKKDKKQVIAAIDAFMRGEQDHGVPDDMIQMVSSMRAHLDNLSKKLVDSGAVPSTESRQNIINNLGSYLNRSYEVFDNKNYANKVTDQVKQAAKNKLREIYREYAETESLNTGVPVNIILEKKVDSVVDGILNQDEGNEFVIKSKLGSKNLTPLEQRKDIPAEIRALMGEYGDPALNYVKSIQKVAAIIANQSFQKQLRKSGEGVYLFNERTGIYNTKIAGDSSKSMDILAGMYTTKDIAEAMSRGGDVNINLGKAQPLYDFYLKGVGAVKYTKTILSLGTHAKNIIGNIPFMIMTGNFNLSAFNKAIEALRSEYSNNGKPELLAKMDEYTRLGIINQSTTLNEIRDLLSSGKTFEDVMIDRMADSKYSRVKTFTKGVFRAAQKAYQVEDDFFKIAAYESEKSKYAKAIYKKNVDQLSDSELKDVSERSANVVKNVLPNYGRVGGYVKLLKAIPIAGTFISFTSESVRTSYNTLDLTAREIADPKTREVGINRLAGIIALASVKAGIIAMWGMSSGDDEEEDLKKVRKFLPFWDTYSTIAPTEIKDGVFKYRSISASDPHGYITRVFNAYYSSDNYRDGLVNAISEAASPWVNPDIFTSSVTEMISNKDKNGNAIFKEGDTSEDVAKEVISRLWKIYEPGTITSAVKIAKSENPWNEAIGQFTGFKEHNVDILDVLGYKSYDIQKRSIESASDYSKAKKQYERGEITIEQLSEQYNISNNRKKAVYAEAMEYYNSAMYFGIDPREIQQKMMDSGIPKYVMIGIMYGEIPDMNQ